MNPTVLKVGFAITIAVIVLGVVAIFISVSSGEGDAGIEEDGVYFLAGEEPEYKEFHKTSLRAQDVQNLKRLVLLEYIEVEAETLLDFLQAHATTIESIYLARATILGNFTRKIHLPALKVFYFNVHGQRRTHGYPSMAQIESLLFFNTKEAGNWKLADVWAQNVEITVIVDGETQLDLDRGSGRLKTMLDIGDIFGSVDSGSIKLKILGLANTHFDTRTANLPDSLDTLILKDMAVGRLARDYFELINTLHNLRVFGYIGKYPEKLLDLSNLPPKLQKLVLQDHKLSASGSGPPTSSVILEHLALIHCEFGWKMGEFHTHFQAKKIYVHLMTSSLALLQSILKTPHAQFLLFTFDSFDSDEDHGFPHMQNFLRGSEMAHVSNYMDLHQGHASITKILFEKNQTTHVWEGRILPYGEDSALFKIRREFLSEHEWLHRTSKIPAFVPNQNTSRPGTLVLNGRPPVIEDGSSPKKPEHLRRNWIRNLTYNEFVHINSSEFLDLLERNQDTLIAVYLDNVRRSGEFNRRVYLPHLTEFHWTMADEEHEESFKKDMVPEESLEDSFLPFYTRAGHENWTIEGIWCEGVDITVMTRAAVIVEMIHSRGRGLFKTNLMRRDDMLARTGDCTSDLKVIALTGSMNPILDKRIDFDGLNVNTLVLEEVGFQNFGGFVRQFPNLDTLRFEQGKSGKMGGAGAFILNNASVSNFPLALRILTLGHVEIDFDLGVRSTPPPAQARDPEMESEEEEEEEEPVFELEELNLKNCEYSNRTNFRQLAKHFNPRQIAIEFPHPDITMLAAFTTVGDADWIFWTHSDSPWTTNATLLERWTKFLKIFGLNGNETSFILDKRTDVWIGRAVSKLAGDFIRDARLNVGTGYIVI